MLSKTKKQNIKQNRWKIEMRDHKLTYVINLLHSPFSNCEVYFNNTMICNANGLYPHKAQIWNEFNSSAVNKKGILAYHGYSFEEIPDAFDKHPFTDRANSLGTGITFSLYGKVGIDIFTCKKLLLPNTKVGIKLIRAISKFFTSYLIIQISV